MSKIIENVILSSAAGFCLGKLCLTEIDHGLIVPFPIFQECYAFESIRDIKDICPEAITKHEALELAKEEGLLTGQQ